MLVSMLEFLLTHNPETSRFNVEDSITKQFRMKVALIMHLDNPRVDPRTQSSRLAKLYGARSDFVHGNISSTLPKGEDLESLKELARNAIRATVHAFLKNPVLLDFLKKH